MDDKSRTNTQNLKDLPPRDLGKDVDKDVKGGSEPVNGLKTSKPIDPINGGR
jgi:hypothetical protein